MQYMHIYANTMVKKKNRVVITGLMTTGSGLL